VFDAAAAGGVVFHAATGIDANATSAYLAPTRRCSHPSRPSSSTSASPGSLHPRCSPACDAGWARACPRPATLASAPARKCHHKRAHQPVATENGRLTRATDSSRLSLVRLKWLSVPPLLDQIVRAHQQRWRDERPKNLHS
jgi:hypothetical protein